MLEREGGVGGGAVEPGAPGNDAACWVSLAARRPREIPFVLLRWNIICLRRLGMKRSS